MNHQSGHRGHPFSGSIRHKKAANRPYKRNASQQTTETAWNGTESPKISILKTVT